MIKITLKIDGMKCGMCEAHINDIIRKNFKIKKVSSSYKENETYIISEEFIDENTLKKTFEPTGYIISIFSVQEYKKNNIFSLLKKSK